MADVSKIKLPDQSIVNIKDYRIPGVDTVPTSGSSNLITSGGVYQDIEDTSRVVSAALNDLNDRVVDIEDEWVTTEEFSQIEQAVRDTYTKQEIDVMIADLESGGVDNVVTQVNVGATPYNPSNGVVSLPAYPTTLPASDVSSWAKASTKPSYTASEVGAATQSDINTAIQNLIGTAPAALDTLGEISDALNDDANLASTLTNQISAKYTKPNTGIPKNDLASDVQTSLGKADTALQSYTETDPTVPAWAKATNKPTYTATEVGAQEVLVSGTNIKTINNQSLLGSGNITISGGGDTSDCVHITGDETVGGDKTFTDNIAVVDASHILYSGASPSQGFTKGSAIGIGGRSTLQFSVLGEPKAFVVTAQGYDVGVLAIIGDSTGCRGIYAAASTYQHNYSTGFSASYSNGTLTITPPSGVSYIEEDYVIVYYYGDGSLTFKTSTIQPGSGVTAVTFTGTGLTEVPAMYACFLETQVNSEQYRRVALYTNSSWWQDYKSLGLTFFSQQVADTTSSFSASYNNGLYINSGGTNEGGYFHNPGTYTLYYLMASDIGGGGSGSYSNLADELDDKQDLLVSGSNIKTINNNSLIGSGNVSVGTITEITMNGTSKGTSGVVNLGTVLTSETALSKGTTTGSGNAVTDISVSGHQITLTKGTTFLTSHQNISGKADLSGAAFTGVVTGTSSGNTAQFRNITISSSEPTSSQGSNGDIWIVV